jgi:hypothetical protein
MANSGLSQLKLWSRVESAWWRLDIARFLAWSPWEMQTEMSVVQLDLRVHHVCTSFDPHVTRGGRLSERRESALSEVMLLGCNGGASVDVNPLREWQPEVITNKQ